MNVFVAHVDLSLAEKLKGDLIAQGFTLSFPDYTLFSAKKRGVVCTFYSSGKLVVQGKDKGEFITFYLEPEILQSFGFSYPEDSPSSSAQLAIPHIGIDEAGKGDFFGPLCIAGVYADEAGIKALSTMGVRDSKTLADRIVIALASKVKSHLPHTVVQLFPHKYNELYEKFKNLNRLLAWGHATAIDTLVKETGCQTVIIDQFGNEALVKNAVARKQLQVELTQRHRGEEDIVVAAASILARASFLEGLERLSKMVGISLPKGASAQVITVGKQFVAKLGVEELGKVAKLHFKTRNEICDA